MVCVSIFSPYGFYNFHFVLEIIKSFYIMHVSKTTEIKASFHNPLGENLEHLIFIPLVGIEE